MLALVSNGKVIDKVMAGDWFKLPNGNTISPAKAGWSDGTYMLVEAEVTQFPTSEDPPTFQDMVNAERDRRLALPFTFNNSPFDADGVSLQRISGMASLAGIAIVTGALPSDLRWHGGETDFAWITADNAIMPLDAYQMLGLGKAAAAHVASIVFAAKLLKDMGEQPANYTDDIYWP